jgi:2C-methyl-D-erythritol 2,4-cyclodiphosphate synthase
VKATRAEGLGALGRAEGIACTAVVLLTGDDEPAASGPGDGEAR